MIYIYKCLYDVYSLLRKGYPISFVQLKDNKYNIILNYGNKCDMVSIDIKLKYVRNIENIKMNLHAIQIDMNKDDVDLNKVRKDQMKCYLIGLPVKCDDVDECNKHNYLYYVISANWMEIDENGMIMKPKI